MKKEVKQLQEVRGVSPFLSEKSEQPWSIWTKQHSVMELQRREESRTCTSSEIDDTVEESGKMIPVEYVPMQINRNQYHAVIGKLRQATSKASDFKTWTS